MKRLFIISLTITFLVYSCKSDNISPSESEITTLIEPEDSITKTTEVHTPTVISEQDKEIQEKENKAKIEKMIADNPKGKNCDQMLEDYELFLEKNVTAILNGSKKEELQSWNTNGFLNECIKKNSKFRIKKDSIDAKYFGKD